MHKMLCLFVLTSAHCAAAESRDRVLPLWHHLAGDHELPLPFGLCLNFYTQTQRYDLIDLKVNGAEIPLENLPSTRVDNSLQEYNVKLDAWLLPFLNLYGLAGGVTGENQVSLGDPLGRIGVEYEGFIYGGGIVLAAGCRNFFFSVNTALTAAELDTSYSSIRAWVLTPLVGYARGPMSIWVGATQQQAEEHHKGDITIPIFGKVTYEVELEERHPWNVLAGARWAFTPRWQVDVEGGFGERRHLIAGVNYRF
ncbi:hypothetical protein JW905_15520 [bacterium]|nr:hypothetical protein [candidate division CSSED10-310 bacterium]